MKRLYNFLDKSITYLNKTYFIKYVDKSYWELIDENGSDKITTLLKEPLEHEIIKYFPETDMEAEKKNNINYYHFLKHVFSKYIYKIKDCIIDPDYNWVILGKKQIFKYSFPMAEDPWDKQKPRPSAAKYLSRIKPMEIERAILVKYSWSNYYHFFIDALPQIMLCDKYGLPDDIPVIVPNGFSKKDFVREYFEKIDPPKRKIIVQEQGRYIRVKELYVAKDTFFSDSIKDLHHKIPGLLKNEPGEDTPSPALLFVTRGEKYKRNLQNEAEIEGIARDFGFTIIDPGSYNISRQIRLFSNATHIIGIHGAAMVNMIFSKNEKLNILEIFPGENLQPAHYSNLARVLGYHYKSITGTGLDNDAKFYLDKEIFLKEIKEMMGK